MGWQAADAYERQERQDDRDWLAAQPPVRRLAIRAGRTFRLAIFVGIVAGLAAASILPLLR
jgi:hypothetical protein